MKRVFVWVVCCAIFLLNPCISGEAKYQHKIDVENMSFQWTVKEGNLDIKLTAKTTGWVGIGFNPSKGMKDADFIIGYVKNGTAKARDDFGVSERKHSSDKKSGGVSNITNLTGSETNGTTEIAFTIPLNSGDSKDTVIKPEGETTVLLSYGAGRDSFLSKHQFKKTLNVNLTTANISPE